VSSSGNRNSEQSGNILQRLAKLEPGLETRLIEAHLRRMDAQYFAGCGPEQIAGHLRVMAGLGPGQACRIDHRQLEPGLWEVTVVAYDHQGLFSFIAGSLASVGLSIERGQVWTWAAASESRQDGETRARMKYDFRLRRWVPRSAAVTDQPLAADHLERTKIVDVFTVRSAIEPDWIEQERNLNQLVQLLLRGKDEEARAKVGRRVIEYLGINCPHTQQSLLPVRVQVDNKLSEHFTSMDIEAEDTPAFLFLFTNALAMRGVNIHSITIGTSGGQVSDRFLITDSAGRKIDRDERIDELRFIVVLVKQFSHLLVASPDPAMALKNFEKLVERIWDDRESGVSDSWRMLDVADQPVLEALARLFGTSNFLWEDFLRLQYENLLPVFQDLGSLDNYKDKADMWSGCELELLEATSFEDAVEMLNRFKDREMFRIDMRHILDRITSFTEFSRELTDLVEVVVEQAYRIADSKLRVRYGQPLTEDNQSCRFAVFALGKAGGRELGYASDIEVLFVNSGPGKTAGPEVVDNSVYFEKMAKAIIKAIRAKRQGIFELDLRFRPFGNQGPLCNTLRQIEDYYSKDGPAWDFERQCLVRMRTIAGDEELGRRVCDIRDKFVYSGDSLDYAELARLHRKQQVEYADGSGLNAKFSDGGLVDVEYHVQHLQITHGARDETVRLSSTRKALEALRAGGYVTDSDSRDLRAAHDFLRRLINSLRILRGNARDLVVPDQDSEEFLSLARRMGYPSGEEQVLAVDLHTHTSAVKRIVDWESKVKLSRGGNENGGGING
jgi:[glutamine synthetase] adenylyltransferase / [glutamine synthetase]-adenylyl-L-tyrosine phosphorylase